MEKRRESPKKVLVIDDEAHIRRVIELKLKNRGYAVVTASNGEEGLYLIHRERPDVVISDIMMPRLDGKTLCEVTDDLKKDRSFLTIIMTCRISPEEHEWVDGMQETLFMEKPFSPARLVRSIDEYFHAQEK